MSQPRAKYLIVTHPEFPTIELPIMFAEALPHKLAAQGHHVIAAGFCSVTQWQAHAFGESVGLNLKSRGEVDEALLRKSFCWSHAKTSYETPAHA